MRLKLIKDFILKIYNYKYYLNFNHLQLLNIKSNIYINLS